MNERPIDIWRRRLDFLQGKEAIISDPAQQFTLQEQIQEAQRKIAELDAAPRVSKSPVSAKSDAQKSRSKTKRSRQRRAVARASSPSSGDPFLDDLREMIDRKQVVVIVGSGVSAATTSQSREWPELIQSAIECCRLLGASERWCEMVAGQLELEDEPDMLLSAAELVYGKLGRGLPIGSLTSQHFAHFYLGWFDRFAKEKLRIKGYVRYMDDVAIWSDSRLELREVRDYLAEELSLDVVSAELSSLR